MDSYQNARKHEVKSSEGSFSVKPLHSANDNLTDRTCQVWQPRLGRHLSREDARQIKKDVVGFFSILAEWSRAELPAPANDSVRPNGSDDEETPHER